MITATAPGKIVLWGEYAVLDGAPAAVMAVSRLAQCSVANSHHWLFNSAGYNANPEKYPSGPLARPTAASSAWLAWNVLQQVVGKTPQKLSIAQDTRAFYDTSVSQPVPGDQPQTVKLGIGSSAALCTALHAAICAHIGQKPQFRHARKAHRDAQGGRGSGIDIAASFYGGVQQYTLASVAPISQPVTLAFKALFTGEPASTQDHLKRFEASQSVASRRALTLLGEASEACCKQPNTLDAIAEYTQRLFEFDRQSGVGIATEIHQDLHKVAAASGVVYKPCGAGGGDVGMAFAKHGDDLQRFLQAVQKYPQVKPLALEIAQHGVRTTR